MPRRTGSILLRALTLATFLACSDGATPTAPARPSASRSPELEAGPATTIDVPGATATVAFGINNDGVIVGRYAIAGRTHGFVRSVDGELTTVDFPGASLTVAAAINNRGDVAGWYILPAAPTARHAYVLRDGEFTTVDPPGTTSAGALGINDRGDVTGRFCTLTVCRDPGNGDYRAFLLRDGELTTIDVPGSRESHGWKINDRGEMVGAYEVAGGGVGLFVYRNGELTTFALPNGKPLSNDNGGINARGDIVGKYCETSPCPAGRPTDGHGFVLSDGRLTTIDIPGALTTATFGINAGREIVGGYFDARGALHGYVMQLETRDDADAGEPAAATP